jgi:predicted anti-sigma-YlaC factor YlaD
MSTCKDIQEKLSAFIDDELPPAERGLVERHLQACPSCAEEATSLRKISDLLDSIPNENPAPVFTAKAVHRALAWKRCAYVKEQIYRPVAAYILSVLYLILNAEHRAEKRGYPSYRYLRNFDDFPPESFSSVYVALIQGEQ